jgi:PAS domain S-box-containing protein
MPSRNGKTPFQLLLVEDRTADADLLILELRRAGVRAEVKVVSTRAAYLDALDSDLDAILSDFDLPQFGAKEALTLLQARKLDVPFIVVSGTIGEETAVEIMKRGATDYLLKDRLARLPQALTRAIGAAQLRHKNESNEKALRLSAIQTGESLRRRNEQYRVLFATYPSPTWVYDDKTLAFVAVNDAAVRHYGYSREHFLAMTIRDIRPQEDIPALLVQQNDLDDGPQHAGVWRHRKKNGEVILADIHVSQIQFEGRKAHLVVATDITQQRRGEEAIRRSESRLRAIIDNEPECVKTVSAEGLLLEMNAAGLKMIEAENLAQVSGWPVTNLVHPDDRLLFKQLHDKASAGGAGQLRFRVVSLKGRERWMETHSVGLDDGQPGPRSVLSVTRDITDQLAAAEGMRMQANMLDQVGQAVIATDLDDKVIYANRFAAELYGWTSPEEICGTAITDLTVPTTSRTQADEIMAKVSQGNKWSGEFVCRRRDGSKFDAFCTTSPLFNKEGARVGSIGTSTDISERKKAEATLQKSEADLAKAQRIAHLGSWEWNLITGEVLWSAEFYHIFGLSPDLTKPSYDVFQAATHPDDRESVTKAVDRSLASGEPFDLDFRIIRPDGVELTIHETAEMAYDESGKALRMTGIVQDITERKQREEALAQAEAKYRSIFDHASEGIFQNTPEGVMVSANPALARMMGFSSPEEMIRERYDLEQQSYAEPSKREKFKQLLEEKDFVNNFEYEAKRKDGSMISISENVRIVRDAAGNASYYEGSVQDITERKLAQKVLAESERRLRFLNELNDALRGLSQPRAITATVGRLLGTHLGVSRCAYAEVEQDGDHFTVSEDYTNGCASIAGIHRLSDFGPFTNSELAAGRTIVLRDVQTELTEDNGVASFKALQVGAMISCPLIKEGKLVSAMAVHQITPREWTEADIALVEEVVGRCWSIIEGRRAEMILRKSEEHLRLVIAASNDGIWEHNYLSESLTWSDRMYEMLGLDPGSFTPTIETFAARLHPDDRAPFQEAVQDQLAKGGRYQARLRIMRQDGSYGNFLGRGCTVHDAEGNAVGVVGSLADLTHLLEAEGKLLEQADLLNLAPDAIMVRSLDDRILFWNRGAEAIYGWTSAEAIGRREQEFLYADSNGSALARKCLLEADAGSAELRQVTRDGAPVTVDSRWTLVRDEQGLPKSVLVINTDITDKQKLAAQFLRAQRVESIGTLASGVAHDLNNILSPILMGAAVLRRTDLLKADEAILSTIEMCAQRGADIVKQVLTFARGAEGEHLLLQPAHLIAEMAKIVKETFPKTISIRTAYSEKLWLLQGDPTQLHQVLLNLTVNARDAMPGGGTLTISAENFPVDEHYASMMPGAKAGPHVLIQVKDTGLGIPHQIVDKIFDPFFTTKEIGKGTGLGLSTVIGIVKSHGGFVGVYSEIGRGTTFKVFIPATIDALGISGIPEKTDLVLAHGELLLLVDDEQAILIVAEALLKGHGYKVLTATDAPEALAIFAQRRDEISLVLTDLSMPIMDGLALIRTLQKMKPNVRIVASTGRGAQGNEAYELARLKVSACLSKPYNKEKLLTTLHEVIHNETTV